MSDEEYEKWKAKYIAAVIRDGMEEFHCDHLSDKQMAELNPIIRNAVYFANHALDNYVNNEVAAHAVCHFSSQIPAYWEDPELPPFYVEASEKGLEKFYEDKNESC
jgi:hypothetical protein